MTLKIPPQVSTALWRAGDVSPRSLYTGVQESALQHVALLVTGVDADVELDWGNRGTSKFLARPPMAWTVAGKLQVTVTPRVAPGAGGASAILAWADVASPASYPPRALVDATAGAVALSEGVGWVTPLAAATMTVAGVAVGPVAVGQRIPVVSPTVLNTGIAVVELLS